jgi:hypothetical protein
VRSAARATTDHFHPRHFVGGDALQSMFDKNVSAAAFTGHRHLLRSLAQSEPTASLTYM